MGGASEVIARLSDGFDTYLERPLQDLYEGLPDGASIFGGKVDNDYLRGVMDTPTNKSLSGGEMQRVAVARTFMRSMSEEQKVGLLLFDEPSASLDTKAEQGMTSIPMTFVHVYLGMLMWLICTDLFSRLRELRGNKTMVFSTHRFGDLTRHADIILWVVFLWIDNHDRVILIDECYRHMNESVVVETGTHKELMKREGSEYARLWHIQAQAFL